jgi:hypothetical protein
MEENNNKKTFIAFLDDDGSKKEDWVTISEKTISYVEFIYKEKLISIPWIRILKIKEVLK